jgi:leucyl aminopeptidase (aminopeptidase T)
MLSQSQFDQLAQQFLGTAVKAKDGESVWVEYQGDVGRVLADHCAKYLQSIGANPFVIDAGAGALRSLFDAADQSGSRDDYFVAEGQKLLAQMKTMQGYIRICDRHDVEKANFNPDDMMDYRRLMMKDTTDYRVKNTRWLVVDAPTPDFAASCRMDQGSFDEFYFNACMTE